MNLDITLPPPSFSALAVTSEYVFICRHYCWCYMYELQWYQWILLKEINAVTLMDCDMIKGKEGRQRKVYWCLDFWKQKEMRLKNCRILYYFGRRTHFWWSKKSQKFSLKSKITDLLVTPNKQELCHSMKVVIKLIVYFIFELDFTRFNWFLELKILTFF